MSAQLREDLKQLEVTLKRKLSNETAAHRAAEEELTRVRQELSQLQGMLGPGVGGFMGGIGGGLGLSQAPSLQANEMWRNAAGGPPAMAAPGLKWVLVKEGEEPAAAGLGGGMMQGDDGLGSLPGTPHSVRSAAAGSSRALGILPAGSTASSIAGFDTLELLQPGMSDAASTGGPVSPSIASSSAQQLHAVQLRQVQQRLGGGTVGEAQLHRMRAALRQKSGECASLQGRLRELEETRDALASELVKATHAAEKVCGAACWPRVLL